MIPLSLCSRDRISFLIALSLFLFLGLGCGGGSTPQPGETQNSPPPAAEIPLTKDEVLGILAKHGLNPQTRPTPHFSSKMDEALKGLPEGPKDHFMLGINNEGMIAFEFKSVEIAEKMERGHKANGIRHRNWYFGGQVSAEVYAKMKEALKKG